MTNPVTIFIDGACLGNPGPGGFAALILGTGPEVIVTGHEPDTTNNRMELTAAIKGLEAAPLGGTITLHSDSEYVIKGMSTWLPGWKAKGWRTAAGKPVKNRDLWERLEAAAVDREVTWKWVKGHAGHPENERVDALANAEAARGSAQPEAALTAA